MKLLILSIVLVIGLIVSCSPLGPAEIPLQSDTGDIPIETGPSEAVVADESEEISVSPEESSPSGAVVVEESPTTDTSLEEAVVLEEEVPPVTEPAAELGPQSTYITLTDVGFGIPEVRIKVGETVAWKNEREGRQQKAMVFGTQWCSSIVKSRLFGPGEVYRATFNKVGTCTVVDGMYTTEIMKVIVTE